jgi:hypothetical protein
MQNYINKYINDFFTKEEKQLFLINNNELYHSNKSWGDIENEYKQLTQSSGLQNFHMKTAESASYFIHHIFQKHVDEQTFVVYGFVHSAIKEETDKISNKYQIKHSDVINFDVDKIIYLYKNSGCNKIFIYLPQTIEQKILLQAFCEKLKKTLCNSDIEHIIVLDDVATMFIIPKDYSYFDYVIFTCHSLVPTFDCGLLFYKECVDFGSEDSAKAELYLKPLQVILSKRDKLLLFDQILYQYFAEELHHDLFYVPEKTSPNIFHILYKDNQKLSSSIVNKYKDKLASFCINCNESGISICCCHFIKQDAAVMMEGLAQLKSVIQKCIKLKERL